MGAYGVVKVKGRFESRDFEAIALRDVDTSPRLQSELSGSYVPEGNKAGRC